MYQAAPNQPANPYPNQPPNYQAGFQDPNYNAAYAGQPSNPAYQGQNNFYQTEPKAADPYAATDPYDPYNTDGLSDKLSEKTRLGFIRKVMMILATQLTFTAVGIIFAVANADSVISFFSHNPYLLWVAIGVYIVTLLLLCCVRSIARTVPQNYICLGIFTCAMTVMCMAICAMYDPQSVMIAAILTAVMVCSLMFYAITTKTDFTLCIGVLWALILVSLTCIILSIFMRSRILQIMISGVAIVIVSFYIVFDTQLIIGNKENKLQIDDYVFAAMMLYLDIIRLFLEILKILGSKR